MFPLLLLAFAVSLDSFSVGFTYGLRKLKIPLASIVIIACCSAVMILVAMIVGNFLTLVLPPYIVDKLGGIILVLLGAWVLYQFFRQEQESAHVVIEKTLLNVEIKSLGIVINILRKPTTADLDQSGTISGVEALLLGIALSLDAFGAGIGAAILGYSPLFMCVAVAIMSSLFVFLGINAGHVFSRWSWMEKMAFLPGVLLIIIGIWRL
jgi:putative sporulation protein YtaF